MTRHVRSIQSLDDISIGLQFVSQQAHAGLERLMIERATIDGWSSGNPNSERVTGGSSTNTATEAAMLARYEAGSHIEQIRDDIEALAQLYEALKHDIDIASRWRAPSPPKQIAPTCHDGQLGKDGVLEWGDTPATDEDPGHHCLRPQERSGMCPMHFMRWYRHMAEVKAQRTGAAA